MKHLITACIILVLTSCKTGEGIDNDYSNLRTDGFYMGRNLFASTKPDTVNGKAVARNVFKMLRFYSLDSGVIIQEPLAADFQMTDSANTMYYNWCRQFETQNPADKDFVNFKFRLYGKDSIRFSQVAPDTRIDYTGKIYKDSIALKYVLHPIGMGALVLLPPKPVYFKFYPKKM